MGARACRSRPFRQHHERVNPTENLFALRVMESSFSGPPELTPEGFYPWFNIPLRRSATATIVIGHWAAMGLHMTPNLLALDSGCVYGRQLTAIRLEDRKVFQVACEDSRAEGSDQPSSDRPASLQHPGLSHLPLHSLDRRRIHVAIQTAIPSVFQEPRPRAFPQDEWSASEDYLYAIDLYNFAYWWESHEIFEGLWHACGRRTQAGNFFQALIQLAAANLKQRAWP